MPSKRDPNRIQVDLKLLQDRNLKLLKEFGDQFERAANTFAQSSGNYAQQLAGAGNQVQHRPGQTSQAGSEAPLPPLITPPVNSSPTSTGSSSNASHWSLSSQGYGSKNITEYEKAQFSLGNIGEMDFSTRLKYLSHLAQTRGYEFSEEANNGRGGYVDRAGSFAKFSRVFGGALGAPGRVTPYLQSARGMFQNIQGIGTTNSAFVMNSGGTDNGFFNQAAGGLHSKWDALSRSEFGFSRYSTEAAMRDRQVVNEYGYGGHQANHLLDMMKSVNISSRGLINGEDVMKLVDPAKRFGTDSMQQMVDVLHQIPDAARAAHMGVKQFTEDLVNAAQGLAGSTNMTMGGAAVALSAMASATGLAPQKVAGILGDQQNLYMSMAMTGKSAYQLTYGDHAGSDRFATPIKIAEGIAGMSLSQLTRLKQTDPKRYDQVMSNLILTQQANPSLFGGMDVKTLVNLGNRGPYMDRMRVDETLGHISNHAHMGYDGWNHLYSQAHLSAKARQDFFKEDAKRIAHGDRGAKLQRERAAQMSDQLATAMRKSGESARAKTTFDLTPEARKLVKFMDKTDNKAYSNSKKGASSFSDKAIHFGESVLQATVGGIDPMFGPLGGALGGL